MFQSIKLKLKNNNRSNLKENKVVCQCLNVTEQDIKYSIKEGADSFLEVQIATRLGTGCGKCISSNQNLVAELLLVKKIDNNQIICGCFQVTAHEIVNVIHNGAKSFEEVQDITRIGTGCGHCVESNKALVSYILSK